MIAWHMPLSFCSAIWNAQQQHLTAWSSAPQRNPKAPLPTWQLSITEPSAQDVYAYPALVQFRYKQQNFFYDQPMKNLPIGGIMPVRGFAYGNLDLTLGASKPATGNVLIKGTWSCT